MLSLYLNTISNAHTRDAYGRDVARFIDWLGSDLSALDADDVLNFLAHLRAEGFEPSSINRQLAAVRAFLRWAALTGRATEKAYNASRLVKSERLPKKLPRPLTQDEVERLLAQPKLATVLGARDYALILFMLATGARLAEVLALNVQELQFDNTGGSVILYGKGEKERVSYFDEEAAAALVYYLGQRGSPQEGPLFVTDDGNRLSHRRVQRRFDEYGRAANVEVHPHKLRRTFAVDALNATGDLHAVSTLMGHNDIRTTEIYTKLANDSLRQVAAAGANHRRERQQTVRAEPAPAPTVERGTDADYCYERQPVQAGSNRLR